MNASRSIVDNIQDCKFPAIWGFGNEDPINNFWVPIDTNVFDFNSANASMGIINSDGYPVIDGPVFFTPVIDQDAMNKLREISVPGLVGEIRVPTTNRRYLPFHENPSKSYPSFYVNDTGRLVRGSLDLQYYGDQFPRVHRFSVQGERDLVKEGQSGAGVLRTNRDVGGVLAAKLITNANPEGPQAQALIVS